MLPVRTPTGTRKRATLNKSDGGLLLVDKPGGLTSHDVVARVRRLAATRKVGHGGTLDPMATGLLVLGVARGTKLLTYVSGLDKTYEATIRLGAATTTDDAEGEPLKTVPAGHLTSNEIELALQAFRGDIMQVPSSVSAIKVAGRRAYQRVRSGEDVVLPARPVRIHRLDVTGPITSENGHLDVPVVVECTSGTYIRALARDVGEALGVGGHLVSLRRTRVGPWEVGKAKTLPALAEPPALLGFNEACPALFPAIAVSAESATRLRHGGLIDVTAEVPLESEEGQRFTACGADGEAVGIVEVQSGRLKPVFIVAPA